MLHVPYIATERRALCHTTCCTPCIVIFFVFLLLRFYFVGSGQAAVTGVVPTYPWFLPSVFIAHRVQQSHCSSICYRVMLTHALAPSASQFFHKKNSLRVVTTMRSASLELTKTDQYQARGLPDTPPRP